MKKRTPPTPRNAQATIDIAGEAVPLEVNWHARARRFILRLDAASGGARLTLPVHADLEDAIGFVRRHEGWLMTERRRLQGPSPIAVGAVIPYRGQPHAIVGDVAPARRVWLDGGEEAKGAAAVIRVSGPPDTAPGRILRWLKTEAREHLATSVSLHSARLGLSAERLAVRDQQSRWGSCSTSGTLSFSWRLVMAPPAVLDYVAAHEVAHLAEMNHGPRFWKLVRQTYGDHGAARRWLRTHGRALHRYGT